MIISRQKILFRLCEEFEHIAEKALSTPMDTAELMDLKEYMTKVETETILLLEQKLAHAGERLSFLIEYSIASPQEMRLVYIFGEPIVYFHFRIRFSFSLSC